MKDIKALLFTFIILCLSSQIDAYDLLLRDNIAKASKGDYIVLARAKNLTLWHIYDRTENTLRIEEVTVPGNRIDLRAHSWKEWILQDAPGNISWIIYTIHLENGDILNTFSYTKNSWQRIGPLDNILTTLLNLPFHLISERERKKIGMMRSTLTIWNPCMVVDGHVIDNVPFDAFKARWPKDGSDLSGKLVEIYLPQEGDKYPSYLPYWLEASGMIGKAKVRIIDAGKGMHSPRSAPML